MNQNQTYRLPVQQSGKPYHFNKEFFRQLVKNSFDMIVLIDADGIQQFVSESCEKILGFHPEELQKVPVIAALIHPEDRQKCMQGLQQIIHNKGAGGTQYRHRHKNGSWVYLEAFGTNQLENPDVQAVVLNVRDITEHKHLEQALRESERRLEELNAAKDRFFSIIAHDLKSPFNSILGLSDLLMEQIRLRDFEEVESYALGIKYSARRTLDLLTNLLEWSRIHTGRMKYTPMAFDLVRLVDNIFLLMENAAKQKGISLFSKLPAALPVVADKDMIATVLRNLISNGIKFSHPGGGVVIHALKTGDLVKVTVSDNGVGIPAAAIDKLFKLENSFSTQGTRREQGTGLGLLLCKEFIDMHGKQIGVESELGKGSRFWFTLSAAPANSHSMEQVPKAAGE